MNGNELKQEVQFGLENLGKIQDRICYIQSHVSDQVIKTSALTYECLGYYNAVEHLILRFLKFLKFDKPSGPSSHRDILKNFESLCLSNQTLSLDENVLRVIRELMPFRHIATKIYGFLIDEVKLNVIVARIQSYHNHILDLITKLVKLNAE